MVKEKEACASAKVGPVRPLGRHASCSKVILSYRCIMLDTTVRHIFITLESADYCDCDDCEVELCCS